MQPVLGDHTLKTLGLSGRLNTAFVERVNLAIRQGVSLLVRRTWGTAQTTCQAIPFAHPGNGCRPHSLSLDGIGIIHRFRGECRSAVSDH